MSWWDTSGFSAMAATAIKTAQKKIDKVLDIKDDRNANKGVGQLDQSPASEGTISHSRVTQGGALVPAAQTDDFWDAWLSPASAPTNTQATGALAAESSPLKTKATAAATIESQMGSPQRNMGTAKQLHTKSEASKTDAAPRIDSADDSVRVSRPKALRLSVKTERAKTERNQTVPSTDDGSRTSVETMASRDTTHAVGLTLNGHEVQQSAVMHTVGLMIDAAKTEKEAAANVVGCWPAVATTSSTDDSGEGLLLLDNRQTSCDYLLTKNDSDLPRISNDISNIRGGDQPASTCNPAEASGDNVVTVTGRDLPVKIPTVCCEDGEDLLTVSGDDTTNCGDGKDPCVRTASCSRLQMADADQVPLLAAIVDSTSPLVCSEGGFDQTADAVRALYSSSDTCDMCMSSGSETAGAGNGLAAATVVLFTDSEACRSEVSSSATSLATVAEACQVDIEAGSSDACMESQTVDALSRDGDWLLEQSFDDMVIVEHSAPDSCCPPPMTVSVDVASLALPSVSAQCGKLSSEGTAVVDSSSSVDIHHADELLGTGTIVPDAEVPSEQGCLVLAGTTRVVSQSSGGEGNEVNHTESSSARQHEHTHSRNSSADVSRHSPFTLSDRNCLADDLFDIDTGTSSDIEIISMSTHSESNGDGRLVDFLPAGTVSRGIFKTKMRELSPESSSENSGSGSQSSPPCDRGGTPDHLLSEAAAAPHSLFSSMVKGEASENPLDCQTLLKKLAHMAEVLEARESKILVISQENADLLDVNSYLKGKIEALEEGNVAVENLKEEFGQRLGEMERRLQAGVRDRDLLKKQLSSALEELSARNGSSQTMESMLRDKDEQISSLLLEGEKLSKQQLQSNNVIKKLRAKDKENDELLKAQRDKLDVQKKEIERLQTVLDSKIDNEKQHSETIKQLNAAAKKYLDESTRLKSEAEESQEKLRSMQAALDGSYKEIAELLKASASKESRVQELALSAEMLAKEELRVALERLQREAARDTHSLTIQVEDLQLAMARAEKEHARREMALREDAADVQRRLQEADARSGDLTRNIALSTRPLLRQIENLQATHSAQSEAWERLEKNLTERLADAQGQLASFAERDHQATERAMEASSKLAALESQCSAVKQERLKLITELDIVKARLEMLEEDKTSSSMQFASFKQNLDKDVSDLKKEKVLLENQLEMEKLKADAERKKSALLHEQLKDKEQQLSQLPPPVLRGSPTPLVTSMIATGSRDNGTPFLYRQEDLLERALQASAFGGGMTGSLYESMRQSGASALIENLESQLKCRDGEILQLQSDLAEMERSRAAVMSELVQLTAANEKLQQEIESVSRLKVTCQDLDQRCNALLQMYGEKVEEANELRMDLQDVKEMYKNQIDVLMAKSLLK